jgi:glycosyltransferase involved in cell wall biosynthesis
MAPKVSVVVPAYNAQSTLDAALSSVLEQTMPDLEVIVVDDGSRDDTWALMQRWHELDPERVRVLQHPSALNRGVAATRNLALECARGEYIAFLDADDAWVPHKLEVQLQAFKDLPMHVGVVFSNAWLVREMAGQQWPEGQRWLPPMADEMSALFSGAAGSSIEQLLLQPPTEFRNCVMSPTPMVRASHFRHGLRFIGPPRLNTQFEDYLMWLMLALRCEFFAIAEPLAYYRVHAAQFVSKYVRTARCLQYLKNNAEVLAVLSEEDGHLLRGLGLTEKIHRKFGISMVQLLKRFQPSETMTIRTIDASDVLPLIQMSRRYEVLVSVMTALTLRSASVAKYRVLNANRVAHSVRNALKRSA